MPSHKHKKRKKSHKNQKRQVSSSSDSEDNTSNKKQALDSEDFNDEQLMPSQKRKKTKKNYKHVKRRLSLTSDCEYSEWKVKFVDSESDESQGEEKLTSLVRRSYMNHLQQALTDNFKSWRENCNEFSEDSIQELSMKFSSVLEQKALRACMVSEMYRKSMVSMIRQIKGNTNDGRLFVEENGLSKLKIKLPVNKETQSDSISLNARTLSTVQTQTEPPLTSLLDLPLPKIIALSPASRPYDPAIDFNGTDVTSSVGSKPPEVPEQDVCSITSTSDLCNPESQQSDPRSWSKPSAVDTFVMDRETVDHMTHKNGNIDYEKPTNDDPCSTKDNLDLRISAMGLINYIDKATENSPSESTEKSKKSNWFAEEIAQSCNFTRILLKMSTKQREKVLKKIKELFGEDDQPLTELTEKNITICRKRIASVVVMELTPIYQGKRIASRYLFKYVAKQITKSLMEESYAPDTRSIRKKVRDFFTDGRVIMSESDCV